MHSEFKRDSRDQAFKLMEINARIPRANWLAAYCGVNLPWLAYKDLIDKEKLEINDYSKNVYWIEVSKDIAHSIFRHREENLTLRDYISPYFSSSKTFADVSGKDFLPFFKRMANLVL